MMKNILIILGSPNAPSGELSKISISRLNYCIDNFKEGDLIICTGGWGNHFNVSENAHAVYAKKYLMEHGILEGAFLDFALSSNTVDDAVKIKPIILKLKNIKLTIVTSKFHLERVKIIFEEILKNVPMNFIGVEDNLNKEESNSVILHEKKAISEIKKNGLYY